MLPGCMSAWKKPSRKTWVKKISTPAREVLSNRCPGRATGVCEIGTPRMRSITMTLLPHQSQYTSGTISSEESVKLRRDCSSWPPRASGRARRAGTC